MVSRYHLTGLDGAKYANGVQDENLDGEQKLEEENVRVSKYIAYVHLIEYNAELLVLSY